MLKRVGPEKRQMPPLLGKFLRFAMFCALLIFLLFGLSLERIQPLAISQRPLQFNASRAFQTMSQLAKGFPDRVAWSVARQKAALWLKSEFKQMGYTPQSMLFSEVIAGKQYSDLENIYVEKKGRVHPDEIIVVLAHYDIAETTHEGAMDDASGVGVVMELARVFAQREMDRTLVFLLTDSEEYGAFWGATAFVKGYPKINQVVAVQNFDFVAAGKQTGILTLCDGLKSGYTPLWLRELALNSIRAVNLAQAVDMSGVLEAVERAMNIPAADHGVFVAAGIPAFNWVGQTDNFPYIMRHYHHTVADVTEAMQLASFESFGKSAERLITSVDELPRIPVNFRSDSYWKLSQRYYLPGWATLWIQVLLFIPFVFYGIINTRRVLKERNKVLFLKAARNEVKNLGVVLGALLLGYALLLLLPALEIITQYELFPATQKALLLSAPNYVALLLIVTAVGLAFFVLSKVFVHKDDSLEEHEARHAVRTVFLGLIIFLALLKNGFLAVLLLLPPAYFWTALNLRQHRKSRIYNGMFLLLGLISFVVTLLIMSTVFHIGVVYWYLFLAAAYGLFSIYAVVLFFMALTIMIRMGAAVLF